MGRERREEANNQKKRRERNTVHRNTLAAVSSFYFAVGEVMFELTRKTIHQTRRSKRSDLFVIRQSASRQQRSLSLQEIQRLNDEGGEGRGVRAAAKDEKVEYEWLLRTRCCCC